MGTDVYLSLANVYEAERKALARAACDDMGQSYMRGICAMVAQLESDLLDKDAERAYEIDETEELRGLEARINV